MNFLLFGAGGHARKLIDIVRESGYNLLGFISTEEKGTTIAGLPVLASVAEYLEQETFHACLFHIAVGENSVRYNIFNECRAHLDRLTTLVSGHARIAGQSRIEPGSFIAQGVIVQPNAVIGTCSVIDSGAIIEHDTAIGNFVNVSPGAVICGGAVIEDGAVIGAGSTVIEKVRVGKNTLIGAGAVVINDIEANVVAVGNPARVIKKRDFYDPYLR